jgi:DNA-binding MarR family transcriptional regulator
MLMDLLTRIGQGGLHNPTDLAAHLGTSPELLEQMLDDLARMGYLEPVGAGCEPGTCSSCAGCCSPATGFNSRTLALTDRGRRAIRAAG